MAETRQENWVTTWLLLYDGECPLCQGAVRLLFRLGWTSTATVQAWQEADLDDPDLAERIRTELLLVNRDTDEVLGGITAIRQLASLRGATRTLAVLLDFPLIDRLAGFIYEMIAYNRRLLSPMPVRSMLCACDPPDNPTARRHLQLVLIFIVVVGMALFRLVEWRCQPLEPFSSFWPAVVFLFLVGWLPVGLLLTRRQAELLAGFSNQALVVSAIGAFWLPVAAVALCFFSHANLHVSDALPMAAAIMFGSLLRRAHALAWPGWLPWLWAALIAAFNLTPVIMLYWRAAHPGS